MAVSESRKKYLKHYRAERGHELTDIYTLTAQERRWLGLSRPAPRHDLIRVVVPEHYGAAGVIWQSRYVTPAALEGLRAQYPNLEIVEGRSI